MPCETFFPSDTLNHNSLSVMMSTKKVFVSMDPRLLESLLTILVILTLALLTLDHTHFHGVEDDTVVSRLVNRFFLAVSTVSTIGYDTVGPKTMLARSICIIAQLFMLMQVQTSLRGVYEDRATSKSEA